MAKANREYRQATQFLKLDDCDEYIRRRPIKSLHSLEAEFAELCRDGHQTTAKAAAKAEAQLAKVEARIKAICDWQIFPNP